MTLPEVTIDGEDIILLDLERDARRGMRCVHAWQTEIEESLTMRESRFRRRFVPRTTAITFYTLPRTQGAQFRAMLAAVGAKRVAQPIWPASFRYQDRLTDRLYDAQLHWAPATGDIYTGGSLPAMDAAALLVPLIVGQLNRPRLKPLGEKSCEFSVEVAERSPWEWRMGIFPDGGLLPGYPMRLFGIMEFRLGFLSNYYFPELEPDRSYQLEDRSADNLEYTPVGNNREGILSGTEAPMKWGQGATFTMNRGQLQQMLAFLRSAQGRWKSFAAPVWFQPAPSATPQTPNGIMARLASDEVEINFTSRNHARLALDIWQLPWELNPPEGEAFELPSLAYLYEVAYHLPAGQVVYYRYTDHESNLSHLGHTWQARPIEHDSINYGRDFDPATTKILCGLWADNPFMRIWRREAEGKMILRLYECSPENTGEAELLLEEEVGDVEKFDRELLVTIGVEQDAPAPRFVLGKEDSRVPGDPSLPLAAYERIGEITAIHNNGLDIRVEWTDAGGNPAAQYFAGGYLMWDNGSESQARDIIWHVPVAATAQLIVRHPLRGIEVGDPLKVFPGYNHTWAQSQERFPAHVDGYLGFPFMPTGDPNTSERNPFSSDTPPGKK